ncbi:MAG: DUF2273 domain-containing protein [bacterium]
MNELFKIIILNFWRIIGLIVFFLLALFLVIFGFFKTLFIIAITALGFMLGKWKDEGVSFSKVIKDIYTSMRVQR